MLGAIIGDIVGSPYEFNPLHNKTEDFKLFTRKSRITDDSTMTLAIAKALMTASGKNIPYEQAFVHAMQELGQAYPNAGYGAKFITWIHSANPKPYNSWGNGSAMRVSPIAWAFDNLSDVQQIAKISAEVSHNHPEGIKGAQAVASAIYLARTEKNKAYIKEYIQREYEYDLERPFEELRLNYQPAVSCQGTVPEAISAFLVSSGFEDALRKAVSLGGDTDTIAAIAGSIAEACYDIPEELKRKGLTYLDEDMLEVYRAWQAYVTNKP